MGMSWRHSDKEKFRSYLNRPDCWKMSEQHLKTLRISRDFQAEYDGSIPFTRSIAFAKPVPPSPRQILRK
jgi:hypothetical protein